MLSMLPKAGGSAVAYMRKLPTILNTMARMQQRWCTDRAAGALVSA